MVLPRKPNNIYFPAVCHGQHNKKSLIFVASMANLEIYTTRFKRLSTRAFPGTISCVAFQSSSGKIAVSVSSSVYICIFGDDPSLTCQIQGEYDCLAPVTCLEWGRNCQLLVTCARLLILKSDQLKELTPVLDAPLDSSINTIKAGWSHNCKYIAVLSTQSPYILIFELRGSRLKKVSILQSTERVLYFDWRQTLDASAPCALLTRSAKNVTKIWQESQIDSVYKFNMLAVLEPGYPPRNSSLDPPIHWLTTHAFHEAMQSQMTLDLALAEMFHEFPDMLFQVSESGSMTIWGIQGLTCSVHKSARVSLILKTEGDTFSQRFTPFFTGHVSMLFDSPLTHGLNAPQLIILAGTKFALECYCLNLRDLLAKAWITPALTLLFSWHGPSKSISNVSRHPLNNLVFISDVDDSNTIYEFHTRPVHVN